MDMDESSAQKLVLGQIIQNMKNQEDDATTKTTESLQGLQD